MRKRRINLTVSAIALFLFGCTTPSFDPGSAYLSEEEVIDLMDRPKKWDGRTVTIKIYPYEYGFSGSYIVCFEPCDKSYAESSPFVIFTEKDRFKRYTGEHAVVVRARYSSACV